MSSSAIVFNHFNVCDDVAEMIDREIHKGYMKDICSFINKWIGGKVESNFPINRFNEKREEFFDKNVKGDWTDLSLWEELNDEEFEDIQWWQEGRRPWFYKYKSITPFNQSKLYDITYSRWTYYVSSAIRYNKLDKYKVYELKQHLRDNKIKGFSKLKKRELIDLCYKFPDCK